jgi:hypothetical protein
MNTLLSVGLRVWAVVLVLGLSACAGSGFHTADVNAWSQWPSGRTPGTYSIEQLPSQKTERSGMRLSDAAAPALAAAGFRPAAAGEKPQFLITLGARVSPVDPFFYDDPFWWRGGLYRYHAGWQRPGMRWPYATYARIDDRRYEREVAVLIRDRDSLEVLYEVRASSEGQMANIRFYLPALYSAAMKDFPVQSSEPRAVRVPLEPNAPATEKAAQP